MDSDIGLSRTGRRTWGDAENIRLTGPASIVDPAIRSGRSQVPRVDGPVVEHGVREESITLTDYLDPRVAVPVCGVHPQRIPVISQAQRNSTELKALLLVQQAVPVVICRIE